MITIDLPKAKVIAHDARRATRNAALQVSMDAASNADELKALMPVAA
jgi:hypothetical protein